MIVINKKEIIDEGTNEVKLVPERRLTAEEKETVIFTLSNATEYIHYQKGDTLPEQYYN